MILLLTNKNSTALEPSLHIRQFSFLVPGTLFSRDSSFFEYYIAGFFTSIASIKPFNMVECFADL